jgi:hypothetical protein
MKTLFSFAIVSPTRQAGRGKTQAGICWHAVWQERRCKPGFAKAPSGLVPLDGKLVS